jgi:hypothetical protein
MVARENSLRSDDRDHLNSLQALMKKRDDLDKAITAQVIIDVKLIVTISNNNRFSTSLPSFLIF